MGVFWIGGSKAILSAIHVFQTTSKSGIRATQTDINLIDARMKRLTQSHTAPKRKGGANE
jgi:hypothetical protein